ncbi:MAG: glutamine synthetase beta-grasp domain-containing protein [Gammaproteobacteria bacterium]
MIKQAVYIWSDGTKPTNKLRSKTRILEITRDNPEPKDFPEWGFDGSSTFQATTAHSDLILKPVRVVNDPLSAGNYLVLCEVLHADGSPHETNHRARLRTLLENGGNDHEPWVGFEQEYTLFDGMRPLGWPEGGYPAPQGPFYCGVGADEVYGRELVEQHTQGCIDAGLMIYGTNAEVMPGQWEFQIGPRGCKHDSPDPLTVCDHLIFARWLLFRIGEEYGISATLHPKPVKGDWNGAGKHTNFSTKEMRNPKTGMATIEAAIAALEKRHNDHIKVYGHGLEERLTGEHETAPMTRFSSGVGHRGASVRIPESVMKNGCGYIEDRRPGANADPYEVAAILIETICQCTISKPSV